ncbi:uncharacterized sporulation protein YeaH/YhbH (DUF444 family) [Pararhizobium capsulatum DSM 1112]|uniref:Uncharacterized sporulation protein YeaH/YhbH (DUF444 family) n=1 Tax=Pararhizobium capsulatum DSM 1112 TaxID=1121113 RepID=A0ABU0BM79_9HYPH|nr:uncharacterized sporulation protein YeaH/YhbH (DUF444 family) [Pararhizobium capsulatum DSM 1112]
MVKDLAVEGLKRLERHRVRLLSILKRADYATSHLKADIGVDRDEQDTVIRRIIAGTIPSADRFAAKARLRREAKAALANWENEGGAAKPPR